MPDMARRSIPIDRLCLALAFIQEIFPDADTADFRLGVFHSSHRDFQSKNRPDIEAMAGKVAAMALELAPG